VPALGRYGYDFRLKSGSGPFALFQVLGMRSSGTNFVSALIARNIDLTASEFLGWKHGPPAAHFVPSHLLPVIVFRAPLPWLRSLYRKPFHFVDQSHEVSFSRFIRSPVETVMEPNLWYHDPNNARQLLPRVRALQFYLRNQFLPRVRARLGQHEVPFPETLPEFVEGRELQLDRHPITGLPFATPLEMRATKCEAFLGFANRACSCAFVQYEFVRRDPRGFLRALADTFGLQTTGPYRPVDEWMGTLDDPRPEPAVTPEDERYLFETIDWGLEQRLGYDPEFAQYDVTTLPLAAKG
jgi:hypothetical protein